MTTTTELITALLFTLWATPAACAGLVLLGRICGKLYRLAFREKLDRLAESIGD